MHRAAGARPLQSKSSGADAAHRGRSLAQIVNELSVYLVGWRGYFGFCQTPSALRALDEWTRRRLRAIAWKQWKRGRTRFAELRRRGVGRMINSSNFLLRMCH
ncbi:MAG: group II intron maturase-specific domain-containing protein [Xanthobacteraceae bacterium]